MTGRQKKLAQILARHSGNSGATQKARMLDALRELGSITTFEAMRFLDVYDPRPRIHDLRHKDGLDIATITRMEETESGALHRVGVYVLISSKEVA